MRSETIERINKFGKVGNIVTLIAKIICIVGLVGCLIATIVCTVFPENFVNIKIDTAAEVAVNMNVIDMKLSDDAASKIASEITENVSVDGGEVTSVVIEDNTITLDATGENISFGLKDIAGITFAATVTLATMLVTLFFIGVLCKAFAKCETPFEENVIKKMNNLAISVVPMVVFSYVTEVVANYVMSGDLNLSIDFTAILVILVLFMLVHIFKYGAVLQQESDETL